MTVSEVAVSEFHFAPLCAHSLSIHSVAGIGLLANVVVKCTKDAVTKQEGNWLLRINSVARAETMFTSYRKSSTYTHRVLCKLSRLKD